jgi:hypothetical protein
VVWISWALRLGIIGVASWVLTGLTPLILDELNGIDACPMLGPIPACYPVGLGYFAMAAAAIFSPRRLTMLFLVGWAPVFLLALSGSTMEILGHNTCPISPAGTPLCFYSLTVAALLLPVFLLCRKLQNSNEDKANKFHSSN